MTAIIRGFSRAPSATDENTDSLFSVLMFTLVGLLLSICVFLAFGLMPVVESYTFLN
jgi:hypothetical protein